MKKLLKYSLSLLLLAAWFNASAQDRVIAPADKSQPASSTRPGPEKKTDTVHVKTDSQNRSYILVDGRKVWVDKPGEPDLNAKDSVFIHRKVKSTK